jgi:isopenicillin-N N-acyltransferase-like protein
MGAVTHECTSLFFRDTCIIGENWDWMRACEELVVLLEMERENGHRILMIAEPGIIGKVGLNNRGLGVALNILHGDVAHFGVPVHVLLRAVLDSATVGEALERIESASFHTYSNLMIADVAGGFANLEFCGSSFRLVDYVGETPIHTNHFLSTEVNARVNPFYCSSLTRLERARQLDRGIQGQGLEKMKRILLDKANGDDAICARYRPREHYEVGTISSIIMDLEARAMWLTHGSPMHHDFQCHDVT